MQSSGMAPQFSDGVKKQIAKPVTTRPGKMPLTPAPSTPKNTHMRGGYAKHQKAGK